MPAESFISLEDESTQQNHCVRNYAEKYAKGKCDIYFMREASTPNKSLVPPIFYTTIVISLY